MYIEDLLNEHHFTISLPRQYPRECMCALGIGDILGRFIILRDKLIDPPLVFDLSFFTDTRWYPNPENALQFRLKLVRGLIKSIPVSESDIIFSFINCTQYQHNQEVKQIVQWNLAIPESPNYVQFRRKYVVFHTKYRVVYHMLQDPEVFQKIRKLFKNLKIQKYDIVLMGEQSMVDTWEKSMHEIGTIYNDLELLKDNNNVIDLTQPFIYNSLNYDNYIGDCHIIKNAEKNILIGYSGQLCTCLAFNQPSVMCLVIEPPDDRFNINLKNNIITDFSKFEYELRNL